MMRPRLWPLVLAAGLLAACATSPAPVAVPPAIDADALVAAIRAAAGSDAGELAVQPLRDPMVEDLRQAAVRFEAQRNHAEAAAALDRALQVSSDDPALLQERAEAAVLLHDFAGAEALARRAYGLGAKVGPLCRRHWATVAQVRGLAKDAAGVASAHAQLQACKVAGPTRY